MYFILRAIELLRIPV